jgi:signal transduction histidine kinase
MNNVKTESGLLPIFRLYLLTQLAIILINLHVHNARGLLAISMWGAVACSIGGIAVLFAYLSWPALQTAWKHAYLPLAIGYAIVFSLVAQELFLQQPLSAGATSGEENMWQLFLFLFVPLALAAWQYGFWAVFGYCLFATVLELILVSSLNAEYAAIQDVFHRLLFIRAISFLLAGYIISRIMQQMRKERLALQEANSKLERFVATLERLTVTRERNRVARELHDTLAHTLSSVALQLEGVDSLWEADRAQARTIMQHALSATRDGLTETRQAIQSLRASPLEDLGLANALRAFAEQTAGRSGAKLSLDVNPGAEGWIPDEVEQCFFRVGQEALENIARYAQAKTVHVTLLDADGHLRMSIQDDGVGFQPDLADSDLHFGLRGMHERAQIIHAELAITSALGTGTQVMLDWQAGKQAEGQAE